MSSFYSWLDSFFQKIHDNSTGSSTAEVELEARINKHAKSSQSSTLLGIFSVGHIFFKGVRFLTGQLDDVCSASDSSSWLVSLLSIFLPLCRLSEKALAWCLMPTLHQDAEAAFTQGDYIRSGSRFAECYAMSPSALRRQLAALSYIKAARNAAKRGQVTRAGNWIRVAQVLWFENADLALEAIALQEEAIILNGSFPRCTFTLAGKSVSSEATLSVSKTSDALVISYPKGFLFKSEKRSVAAFGPSLHLSRSDDGHILHISRKSTMPSIPSYSITIGDGSSRCPIDPLTTRSSLEFTHLRSHLLRETESFIAASSSHVSSPLSRFSVALARCVLTNSNHHNLPISIPDSSQRDALALQYVMQCCFSLYEQYFPATSPTNPHIHFDPAPLDQSVGVGANSPSPQRLPEKMPLSPLSLMSLMQRRITIKFPSYAAQLRVADFKRSMATHFASFSGSSAASTLSAEPASPLASASVPSTGPIEHKTKVVEPIFSASSLPSPSAPFAPSTALSDVSLERASLNDLNTLGLATLKDLESLLRYVEYRAVEYGLAATEGYNEAAQRANQSEAQVSLQQAAQNKDRQSILQAEMKQIETLREEMSRLHEFITWSLAHHERNASASSTPIAPPYYASRAELGRSLQRLDYDQAFALSEQERKVVQITKNSPALVPSDESPPSYADALQAIPSPSAPPEEEDDDDEEIQDQSLQSQLRARVRPASSVNQKKKLLVTE